MQINPLDIKSIKISVCGIMSNKLIEDLKHLFRKTLIHDREAKSEKMKFLKHKQKYHYNLLKLNDLEIKTNFNRGQLDKTFNKFRGDNKEESSPGKKYCFVYHHQNQLINFIFTDCQKMYLDPLLSSFYLNCCDLMILTCDLSLQKDFEESIETYKKFNSEFNHSLLNYKANKELYKNEHFIEQSPLCYIQDIILYKKQKNLKGRIMLLVYLDESNKESKSFQTHLKYFRTEEVNYFLINRENKKTIYIKILAEILSSKYIIEGKRYLMKEFLRFLNDS